MKNINPDLVNALDTLNCLLFDVRFNNQHQAPINRELLSHKLDIIQKSLEEEGTASDTTGTDSFIDYEDFLLPLPEELIPTETGMPHPDVIENSRETRGINTKMDSNHKKALKEKHAKKLKQELALKNKSKPKLGIMPTPFGTTRKEEE